MSTEAKDMNRHPKPGSSVTRRDALKGLVAAATVMAAGLPSRTAGEEPPATAGGGMPRRGALTGYHATPSMKNLMHYFPGTETLGADEMRVTFMGSSPIPRSNQSGTSIFVELGNGDSFIFDLGPGCARSYNGMNVPYPRINNIFLSHLHVDHWGELPYVLMFGSNYGRLDPLRVYGPSGRTQDLGTAEFCKHIEKACNWHEHSFGQFPTWAGLRIEAHEFDWKANPGVAYEKNGVRITHWPISHSVDGAVSYRLDWNGLSFVWTGDGRPSEYTIEHGKGADMLVTECAVDSVDVLHSVFAAQPESTLRASMDLAHTPAYGAGYMFAKANPRVGVISHMSYDHLVLVEAIDEIRAHWPGPIGLGMPDLVVYNITTDAIWEREGVVPEAAGIPGMKPDKEYLAKLRYPKYLRTKEESQWLIDAEIDPKLYYPADQMPNVLKGPPAEWLELPKAK